MSEKRTFGAASRSSPSLRWNSSRYSSGTRPTSRNDITWPSFIAAPFIVPSAETICSAASMWRRSSAFCLPSSPRARLVVAVPSWRAAWPAARPVTRAVREMREVGIRSLAMPSKAWLGRLQANRSRRGALAWPVRRAGGGGGRRGGRGGLRARRGGGGRSTRWGSGWASGPPWASPSAWGSASAWSSCARRRTSSCSPDDVESPNVSSPAVTTTAAIANAITPVIERDHHLAAGEEPAAAAAIVLVEPERIVRVLRIDLDPLLLGDPRVGSRGPRAGAPRCPGASCARPRPPGPW